MRQILLNSCEPCNAKFTFDEVLLVLKRLDGWYERWHDQLWWIKGKFFKVDLLGILKNFIWTFFFLSLSFCWVEGGANYNIICFLSWKVMTCPTVVLLWDNFLLFWEFVCFIQVDVVDLLRHVRSKLCHMACFCKSWLIMNVLLFIECLSWHGNNVL